MAHKKKKLVPVLYQVKPNDTLMIICHAHQITFTRFINLNPQVDMFGCRNVENIFPGEVFVVGHVEYDPLMFTKEGK
jgi:hypothetical protein